MDLNLKKLSDNQLLNAYLSGNEPADAVGLKLNINSASAVNNVSVKMGYNNGAEYRFVYTMDLKAGDNEILLPFDDSRFLRQARPA